MTPGQKGGLALAFVAALIVVLLQPVLDADETSARSAIAEGTPSTEEPSPQPTPTEEPTEEPSPTPTETPAEIAAIRTRLASAFPETCLAPQPLPTEPGQIASVSDGGISIGSPTGGSGALITDIPGPIGWSPSGQYLFAGGLLFDIGGNDQESIFDDPVAAWAWSPQADCVVAVDGSGRVLIGDPGGEPVTLLEGPALAFTVSAARLAVVTEPSVLSIYDVRSRRLTGEPIPLDPSGEMVLAGWRGGSLLYLAEGEGGAELHSVTPRPAGSRDEVIASGLAPIAPVPCGDRFIAVSSEGALLDVNTGEELTDPAFRFGAPSCSAGGTFIAAQRLATDAPQNQAQIVILDSDGGYIQDAGPGGAGAEGSPEWSPSGSQLIFVKQTGGGTGEVWYAEAGGGGSSEIAVDIAPGSLDWNVTAPTGLPVAAN